MRKQLITAMIAAMTMTTTMSMPLCAAAKTQVAQEIIKKNQAIEIALNDSKLNLDDVIITKSCLDVDDGIQEYEIEFLKGNTEYDYDINAKTGEIISSGHEIEDDVYIASKTQQAASKTAKEKATKATKKTVKKTVKKTSEITEKEALDIAIKDAGISKKDITYTEVHKDSDDGVTKYEVEIHVGQKEYSYDINVKNGSIIESDVDIDD